MAPKEEKPGAPANRHSSAHAQSVRGEAEPQALMTSPGDRIHMGGLLLLCLSMAILPSSVVGCGVQVTAALPSISEGLVAVGEFPWVVSLQDLHQNHLAVGSILSKHWILSVASTFQNRNQASALVGVTGSKKPTLVSISTIIPHKDFDEITFIHNIALLKTATPLEFSQAVQPLCFPLQAPPDTALGNCQVAGWMHPRAGGEALRKLSLVDVDPCPLYRIVTTECASHRDGGNVPGCLGHPGNPIMCQVLDTRQWVLKGILSKGGTKCYGPFLYTRVSHYSDWIVATTAKQGMPVSPILVGRLIAFGTTTEQYKGIATPWMEAKALNLTVGPEAEHPQESGEEAPGPIRPQGRILPVYYDYYSGEILPIATAASSQPQGHRGTIPASLLFHLLTFWVTN
ncbi:inactive serine protease 54 [Tiliqua scincoides]|uniref:inactive serine protease 54 n=1 Tax=Tiliqua scincoides TaxID=71010 RepID=UPI00346300E0